MSVSTPTRAQRAERHLMRIRGAGKLARNINRDIFTFSIPGGTGSEHSSSTKRRKLQHDAECTSEVKRNTSTTTTPYEGTADTASSGQLLASSELANVSPQATIATNAGSRPENSAQEPSTQPKTSQIISSVPAHSITDADQVVQRADAKARARARAAKLFDEPQTTTTSMRLRARGMTKQLPIFKDPVVPPTTATATISTDDEPIPHTASHAISSTNSRPTSKSGAGVAAEKRTDGSFAIYPSSHTDSGGLRPPSRGRDQRASSQALDATRAVQTPKKQLRRSARAHAHAQNPAIIPQAPTRPTQTTDASRIRPAAAATEPTATFRPRPSERGAASQPVQARKALSSINPNKDLKKPIPIDDKPKKVSSETLLRQNIKLIAGQAILQRSNSSRAVSQPSKDSAGESPMFDSASLKSFASRHHIMTVAAPARSETPDPEKLMLSTANRQGSIISRKRAREDQEDLDVDDLITNIATLTKGVSKRFSQDLAAPKNRSCSLR